MFASQRSGRAIHHQPGRARCPHDEAAAENLRRIPSETGAEDFAVIRAALSTAKKQGWDILATLMRPETLVFALEWSYAPANLGSTGNSRGIILRAFSACSTIFPARHEHGIISPEQAIVRPELLVRVMPARSQVSARHERHRPRTFLRRWVCFAKLKRPGLMMFPDRVRVDRIARRPSFFCPRSISLLLSQ